jgi:hypothetical protein
VKEGIVEHLLKLERPTKRVRKIQSPLLLDCLRHDGLNYWMLPRSRSESHSYKENDGANVPAICRNQIICVNLNSKIQKLL